MTQQQSIARRKTQPTVLNNKNKKVRLHHSESFLLNSTLGAFSACDGLNGNGLHRSIYLNVWSLVGELFKKD